MTATPTMSKPEVVREYGRNSFLLNALPRQVLRQVKQQRLDVFRLEAEIIDGKSTWTVYHYSATGSELWTEFTWSPVSEDFCAWTETDSGEVDGSSVSDEAQATEA